MSRHVPTAGGLPAQVPTVDLPRTIQPQGLVVIVDATDEVVHWASENAARLLGSPVDTLVGAPLSGQFSTEVARASRRAQPCVHTSGRRFWSRAQPAGRWLILECEPVEEGAEDGSTWLRPAEWVRRLQQARSLEEASHEAAEELRRLTGYERVTVRQYDAEYNAAVIAESRGAGLATSLLGHYYSGLDTPPSARALLLANRARHVADVDGEAVALVGTEPLDPALDLSGIGLRSVSQRHRAYLRNAGARSALLLPLLIGDGLWGLVACYDSQPRWVPPGLRAQAEERAQVLSMRLEGLESEQTLRRRNYLQVERRRVWNALEGATQDLFETLSSLSRSLMVALDAQGLAVVHDDRLARFGEAPNASDVRRIMRWLDERDTPKLFHTDRLGAELPAAARLHETAAGLVALRLSEQGGSWLLGFRPALFGPDGVSPPPPASKAESPSPSDSFLAWRHEMRLRSRPWEAVELESATALTRLEAVAANRERGRRRRHALKMEALAELAGGVAHNFNNLLTALLGLTSKVARSLAETLPEQHEARAYLERIKTTLDRAAYLVDQLLYFTRRQVVRPRIIDLNDVLGLAHGRLRQLLPETIDLDVRLGPKLGLVRADLDQVDLMLDNLVTNARDAMPSGGSVVVATGNAELSEAYTDGQPGLEPGPYVALTVRDTGPGIPTAIRERVFEPFFTTREVGNDGGRGVGLGLATCFGIVRRAGGHIEVHSQPGRGTTFTVFLPRHRLAGARESKDVGRAPEGDRNVPVVLVVDDESLVRFVAVETLQELGCDVLSAASAEAAMQLVEEQEGRRLDLIVTDVVMSRISGPALIDLLRGRYPELLALVTSSYSAEAVYAGLPDDERTRVLPKPFMPEDLERTVRSMLGDRLE